jgi:glutathione S-transferase
VRPNRQQPAAQEGQYAALFEDDEASGFRARWEAIQTGFVDEPRAAVEQADALVAQLMKRLAEVFSDERSSLEQQWDRGDQISTEDLRVALKRYRSFFERLLSL